MATGTYAPFIPQQYFDGNGDPLSSGSIATYIAGTSTPLATYSDVALTVQNGNPIPLNSVGKPTSGAIFLTPGSSYKFIIRDSTGSIIPPTYDNILALPVSAANVDISGTFGEAVTSGQAVYLSDGSGGKTAGSWYRGDQTNTYSSTTPQVGIVPTSVASLGTGTIRIAGSVTGLTSLSVGAYYYVGVAGALTSTAPANRRFLGAADSTSSLVLTGDPPQTGPGSALTLTAHGVVIGNGTSAITATAALTTGQLLVGVTGADPVTSAASAAGASMVLLKANSGTDSSAGATNVDTIAITGLTAKDMLYVKLVAKSATAATANIGLYNSTDSVALNTAVASLAGGETLMIDFHAAQSQASATSIDTRAEGKDTVPTLYGSIVIAAFTQNWTGSWTLALRHGGVTATGTLQWRWSVYKLVGQ